MTITLDFSKEIEAWIISESSYLGISPADLVRRTIEESAAPKTGIGTSSIDNENAEAIAYLRRRRIDEATDDPEELRKADEELEQLKENINANRLATGERLIFS